MNWKYWRKGEETSGILHGFLAYFLLPLVDIGVIYLLYYIHYIEPTQGTPKPTAAMDAMYGIYVLILTIGTIYTETYTKWMLTKYRLSPDGIHLKPILGKQKLIKWTDVKKSAIYTVFWGREGYGNKYIIAFLNLKKYPLELSGDYGCYWKRKYIVLIHATEESIKEYESFSGTFLETGQQMGRYLSYWLF